MGVCAASGALQSRAQLLAGELSLPIVSREGLENELLLLVTDAGLELHETGPNAAGGVSVDLAGTGANARRLATASRRQLLARAVGMKKHTPTIVDATAGLGRDALLLARLGCTVTMIERSAILGAMLREGLERAERAHASGDSERWPITLIIGDAAEVLSEVSEVAAPDVVYLDPMYPPKSKSAAPKKEMRILRRLVGDDPDSDALFDAARRAARGRVVVKRTPHAPPLSPSPTMCYESKLARYDVYLRQR